MIEALVLVTDHSSNQKPLTYLIQYSINRYDSVLTEKYWNHMYTVLYVYTIDAKGSINNFTQTNLQYWCDAINFFLFRQNKRFINYK